MKKPHILMVPYPAQGHVLPLMEFSHVLMSHGIKITFVNTEFAHQRIAKQADDLDDARIRFVSIPDGMSEQGNRFDLGTTIESLRHVMPGELKRVIEEINRSDDEITCIVTDMFIAFPLEIAAEMGLKAAAISPASALYLLSIFRIPMMIDQGIIDQNGSAIKHEMIELSSDTVAVNPSHFSWASVMDMTTQKIVFELYRRNVQTYEKTEWLLCNTTCDVEAGAFASLPNVRPIGPLSAYQGVETLAANFWPEDDSCLNWLHQQPEASVVYVAFGSFAVFERTQFQELAAGLELSGKRFLWVVRPDSFNNNDEVFHNRRIIDQRGRIVSWAPQRAVLSHPSIACFVSHCGWNSTMEGISNGVPFLCWPYFADQLWNESYLCETLKVGLKFEKDENGIISRQEIKSKIEKVMEDKNLKQRAIELKDKTQASVKEGGLSDKNLNAFIHWLKSE